MTTESDHEDLEVADDISPGHLLEVFDHAHDQSIAPDEVSEMIARAVALSTSENTIDHRAALSLLRSTVSEPREELDTATLHNLAKAPTLGFHIGAVRTEKKCPFGRQQVGLPDDLYEYGALSHLQIIERTFGDWRRRSEENNDALIFHRGLLVAAYFNTVWHKSPEKLPDGTARGAVGRSYIAEADVVIVHQTRAEPVHTSGYSIKVSPDSEGFLRPEILDYFDHEITDPWEDVISYTATRERTRPSAHQAIDLLR